MYSPSEDSEDDSDDGGLDRTYSGDDDAFQTDEVVQVQLLEETRRAAEEYLQAVGFERAAASRLALQLDKPVSADSIPEVCSDLIDKHGGGASPGVAPADAGAVPSTAPLGAGRQAPSPEVLAADVVEQVVAVLDKHASLKPRLEAAATSKALAVEMQTHPAFDAAIGAAAKYLDQRYALDALPPTRSTMAQAYEIVVAGRRVAAVDRSTNIKAAKAEVFFAGVIFSRIQPADTPSTLLFPGSSGGGGGGGVGGMASKITAVRPAVAPGDRLAAKLVEGRGGAGGSGSGELGLSSTLTDFESDLAHALALSQEEAGGGPAGGMIGGGGGGGGARMESGVAGGSGGGMPVAAAGGEDYELQAALAASVGASVEDIAVGAIGTPGSGGISAAAPSEEDQLAAALAASLAPAPVTGGGGGGTEDDELARALAMSMEQTAAAAAAPSALAPAPADDSGEAARYGAAVGELMSWGFDKARVLQALEASGGDQQAAANILLG
jgi:hypothetical protein